MALLLKFIIRREIGMNIVYHCFGGAHSSVTAAAIHLGWLSPNKLPSKEDLTKIPYFDWQTKKDHGIFRFMGKDEFGNKVFFIGRRYLRHDFETLVYGLAKMYGVDSKEILLINTMPYINWMMILGGYLSRRHGIVKIGRPIVIKGVQHSFFRYVALVERVKKFFI